MCICYFFPDVMLAVLVYSLIEKDTTKLVNPWCNPNNSIDVMLVSLTLFSLGGGAHLPALTLTNYNF